MYKTFFLRENLPENFVYVQILQMKGDPRRSLPLFVLSKAEASKAEWAGMTKVGIGDPGTEAGMTMGTTNGFMAC